MFKPTTDQEQLARELSMLYVKYQLDRKIAASEPEFTAQDVCTMYKKIFDEFIVEIVEP